MTTVEKAIKSAPQYQSESVAGGGTWNGGILHGVKSGLERLKAGYYGEEGKQLAEIIIGGRWDICDHPTFGTLIGNIGGNPFACTSGAIPQQLMHTTDQQIQELLKL